MFSDTVESPLALFQSSGLSSRYAGFDLTLDVFNSLSANVSAGFVPDSFYATLYLGTNTFGSTISGARFTQAIGLFDLDSGGLFNLASGAATGPSPKGAGWTRYTLRRLTSPGFEGGGFLTVAFQFIDLNGTASDSVAVVDNVLVTPIQHPLFTGIAVTGANTTLSLGAGPPGMNANVQVSRGLGRSDPWVSLGIIPLNGNGIGSGTVVVSPPAGQAFFKAVLVP